MRRGFTLVETLVVLVLVFILAGMGVQMLSTPYQATARSVLRTADQARIVEVMELLVADALFLQQRANSSPPLLTLLNAIDTNQYGEDIRITASPFTKSYSETRTQQTVSRSFGQDPSDLLLITVEKNDMRLSRVFSN